MLIISRSLLLMRFSRCADASPRRRHTRYFIFRHACLPPLYAMMFVVAMPCALARSLITPRYAPVAAAAAPRRFVTSRAQLPPEIAIICCCRRYAMIFMLLRACGAATRRICAGVHRCHGTRRCAAQPRAMTRAQRDMRAARYDIRCRAMPCARYVARSMLMPRAFVGNDADAPYGRCRHTCR